MNKLVAFALASVLAGAGLAAMAQPQPPTPASQDDPVAWTASQRAGSVARKPAQAHETVSSQSRCARSLTASGKSSAAGHSHGPSSSSAAEIGRIPGALILVWPPRT